MKLAKAVVVALVAISCSACATQKAESYRLVDGKRMTDKQYSAYMQEKANYTSTRVKDERKRKLIAKAKEDCSERDREQALQEYYAYAQRPDAKHEVAEAMYLCAEQARDNRLIILKAAVAVFRAAKVPANLSAADQKLILSISENSSTNVASGNKLITVNIYKWAGERIYMLSIVNGRIVEWTLFPYSETF